MELKIELNELEIGYLKQYARVYVKERKEDITENPIIVVERRENVLTIDGSTGVNDCKYAVNENYKVFLDSWEEVKEYLEKNDLFTRETKIEKFPIHHIWKPIAFFLTKKEARKYLKLDNCSLGVHRVYTRNVGYENNSDLATLMPLLKKIGEQLNRLED